MNMSARLQKRYTGGLLPALMMLPETMRSDRAKVLLCAITLQEDPEGHRFQVLDRKDLTKKGPARGLLQFELGGGVAAVMRRGAPSEPWASMVCETRGVKWDRRTIWENLEFDDVLAFAFGRLLLLNLPQALPSPTDAHKAWAQYVEAWGPGKPHPEKWPENHAEAVAFVATLGAPA